MGNAYKVEEEKQNPPALIAAVDAITSAYPELFFDEFFQQIFLDGQEMTDAVDLGMRIKHIESIGKGIAEKTFTDAIKIVAYSRKRHWLRDYFEGLPQWDKEDRCTNLADMLTGVESVLYRTYIVKWLLGSLVRTFEYNTLVKAMLILAGKQDIGKSTLFRALIPDTLGLRSAFNDTVSISTLKHKAPDFWQSTHGCMICEFAELVGNQKENVNALKNMLSATAPRGRFAYGKHTASIPITTIFGGSTNDSQFLRDSTGSSRFMVLPCADREIDTQYVNKNRDQIWAQVLNLYNNGTEHWISDKAMKAKQEEHNLQFAALTQKAEALIQELEDREFEYFIPSNVDYEFPKVADFELKEAMGHLKWKKMVNLTYKDEAGSVCKAPVAWASPEFREGRTKSEMAKTFKANTGSGGPSLTDFVTVVTDE